MKKRKIKNLKANQAREVRIRKILCNQSNLPKKHKELIKFVLIIIARILDLKAVFIAMTNALFLILAIIFHHCLIIGNSHYKLLLLLLLLLL